jgi:aminomethyltransferase
VWDALIASGEVAPCGLGCRDTLRFEVALPLYGHELSDDITPLEAGLGIFVKLDKEEFIGKSALAEQKAVGLKKKIVGIELLDRAIPRAGYPIEVEGQEIGAVTTGYHCLSVDKSVCMALIDARYSALETPVEVRIRKKTFAGKVVKKKFYQKNYKK